MEYAIKVQKVNKEYRLYDRNKDRVLDALGIGKGRYHIHKALTDMDFSVKKGECVGIIGTNGAGKSTILKIITGVLSPTNGNVEVNGRISALLELGAGFNEDYTGIENIYLNGTMMGYTKEEVDARLESILEFADIGDYAYQPVKTYSSGMFVRLAFAVAINIDPEILIVDEALSVGDVFFQNKCYKKFEDFKASGKTILFVSHDLSAINKYCDRAILINKGQKISEGSPKDMIDAYKRILVGAEAILENKDRQEYGNGKATITSYEILDDSGKPASTLFKDKPFTVHTHIKINEQLTDPIFTMSLKNVKGVEICGTNTYFENVKTGTCSAGDEYDCYFTQDMKLFSGDYLLSVSVTGYEDGGLVAYHRLYDVASISVISDTTKVGFFDMDSSVKVEKV